MCKDSQKRLCALTFDLNNNTGYIYAAGVKLEFQTFVNPAQNLEI